MDIRLSEFNLLLKEKILELKILEKGDPRKAKKGWLKLVKFIVMFGNSKNCPKHLKRKIGLQAEQILNKVKDFEDGRRTSILDSENKYLPPPQPEQEEIHFDDERLINAMMQMPEIPDSENKGETLDSGVEHSEKNVSEEPSVQHDLTQDTSIMPSPPNTINSLSRSNETPKGIIEIPTDKFENVSDSIDLSEFKKDTAMLDITIDSLNNENSPFSTSSPTSPTSSTSSTTTTSQNQISENVDDDNDSYKKCEFCGSNMLVDEEICPFCGQ